MNSMAKFNRIAAIFAFIFSGKFCFIYGYFTFDFLPESSLQLPFVRTCSSLTNAVNNRLISNKKFDGVQFQIDYVIAINVTNNKNRKLNKVYYDFELSQSNFAKWPHHQSVTSEAPDSADSISLLNRKVLHRIFFFVASSSPKAVTSKLVNIRLQLNKFTEKSFINNNRLQIFKSSLVNLQIADDWTKKSVLFELNDGEFVGSPFSFSSLQKHFELIEKQIETIYNNSNQTNKTIIFQRNFSLINLTDNPHKKLLIQQIPRHISIFSQSTSSASSLTCNSVRRSDDTTSASLIVINRMRFESLIASWRRCTPTEDTLRTEIYNPRFNSLHLILIHQSDDDAATKFTQRRRKRRTTGRDQRAALHIDLHDFVKLTDNQIRVALIDLTHSFNFTVSYNRDHSLPFIIHSNMRVEESSGMPKSPLRIKRVRTRLSSRANAATTANHLARRILQEGPEFNPDCRQVELHLHLISSCWLSVASHHQMPSITLRAPLTSSSSSPASVTRTIPLSLRNAFYVPEKPKLIFYRPRLSEAGIQQMALFGADYGMHTHFTDCFLSRVALPLDELALNRLLLTSLLTTPISSNKAANAPANNDDDDDATANVIQLIRRGCISAPEFVTQIKYNFPHSFIVELNNTVLSSFYNSNSSSSTRIQKAYIYFVFRLCTKQEGPEKCTNHSQLANQSCQTSGMDNAHYLRASRNDLLRIQAESVKFELSRSPPPHSLSHTRAHIHTGGADVGGGSESGRAAAKLQLHHHKNGGYDGSVIVIIALVLGLTLPLVGATVLIARYISAELRHRWECANSTDPPIVIAQSARRRCGFLQKVLEWRDKKNGSALAVDRLPCGAALIIAPSLPFAESLCAPNSSSSAAASSSSTFVSVSRAVRYRLLSLFWKPHHPPVNYSAMTSRSTISSQPLQSPATPLPTTAQPMTQQLMSSSAAPPKSLLYSAKLCSSSNSSPPSLPLLPAPPPPTLSAPQQIPLLDKSSSSCFSFSLSSSTSPTPSSSIISTSNPQSNATQLEFSV